MFKYVLTIILIFSGLIYSEEIKQHYAQKVNPIQSMDLSLNSNIMVPLQLPKKLNRHELGRTWYDYACNGQSGRTMVHDTLKGIHFAFMKRQPDATGSRYVTYDYFEPNLGLLLGNQTINPNDPSGWGRLVNGKYNEPLVVFHGGGIKLWQGPPINNLINLVGGSGIFPSIARTGDTVLVISQINNAGWMGGDTVLISTDYLQTWAGSNINLSNPQAIYGGSEYWPTFNPLNSMEFSFLSQSDIIAGAPEGSVWLITSTDLGQSYSAFMISKDDSIFVGTQYIIENFGQMNGMYGQDGTYHAVFGAVQGIADTATSTMIDYYPILYWNTREQEFVVISSYQKSHPDSAVASILMNNRPGNGLGGFNYPILSESPTGELVCIWQEWEENASGSPVLVTPAGGSQIFCTDIWGVYSPDGGLTWGNPFYIAGTQGESDVFPNITNDFFWNVTNDSIILDIMYMWDTNAGVSLFAGGNDASECVWYYERVAIPSTILTNTDIEKLNIIDEFNLSQNYPNPFNPTTTIKYNLPKTSNVKIQIFNILGQTVKTLVNTNQNKGVYEITWDGLNASGKTVSGGIYFYKLQTSDFQQTKKMLLLK